MKALVSENAVQTSERAFLIGAHLKSRSEWDVQDSLEELGQLATTAGAAVVGTGTQKLEKPTARTFIGPGKAEEFAKQCREDEVDTVDPSNLKTLIGSIPPYWKPMRAMFDVRAGNVDAPQDAELIRNASPLFKADQIRRPLLIGQGANDPRVKQAESEQIVAAITKTGGRATYVLYPDEGHGFARPENRLDFSGREEKFLAEVLGGRYEPMIADPQPGSTSVVREIGRK